MNNDTPQAASPGDDMLEIPPSVHVACPLVPGKLRQLGKCVSCEHGARPLLVDRFGPGSEHPFAVRYLLRCTYPRSLPLTEIEV